MQLVSQEAADDGRVTIVVRADAEEVSRAVDNVYRKLARRASIPGFRKGKAPRTLLEQHVGIEQARQDALEELAPDAVIAGLREAEIEPFARPELEQAAMEDDGSARFAATVIPRPAVELGEYKGLTAVRPAVEVTDEQVQAQLDKTRERYVRYEPVVDRPAQTGDLALVDYDLQIDGQLVESQSTHGYPSQIGSDNIFPELNQKLPRLKVGDQARIPARIPQDHKDPALAGKEGEFVVTLRELKERVVPELTDDMARQAHNVESVEELRDITRQLLEHLARQDAEDRLRSELLDKVVNGSRLAIPPAILRAEAQARLERLEQDLRAQGHTLDEYLQERRMDAERWLRSQEIQARSDLERMLVLEDIAKREGIEVAQEEISREIAGFAERTGMTERRVRQRLSERDMDRVADRVHRGKVLQFLVDHADIANEGEGAAPATAAAPEPQEEQP